MSCLTRRLLLTITAATALAAVTVAPAQAGIGTWSSLTGLTDAAGAQWVREYTRGAPPNVTTIYAATEGDGVFRSTNGGLSWSPFSSGLQGVPGAMDVRTVYADGATRMLAGTSAGLFSSTNGGAWQPVAQGPEDDPLNPKKLNIAVQALFSKPGTGLLAGGFSSGVWKSGDGGATWTPPAPGNGMPAATTVWYLTSLVPNVVMAATSSGIYRSVDFGSTWQLASDGLSGIALRVFADGTNPNIFYAATTSGVYRSINLGLTWSSANGTGSHQLGNTTVRGLIQSAGINQTRLYAATADGLYGGTTGNGPIPGAVNWRKITNSGLGSNTIFWTISDFIPGSLVAGTQSNGGYALTMTPPVNQTAPAVSGTLKVGSTLTTTNGTWTGTPTIEFAYQWQRCSTSSPASCSDIDGAEKSTYVLTTADFGKYVRSVVTAENDVPTFGLITKESALVGSIGAAPGTLPGDNQSSTGSISGPGLPQSGDTLQVQSWLFNPAATNTSFAWFRCTNTLESSCTLIPGATGSSYKLTDADVTLRIRARVTGTNVFGSAQLGFTGATNTIFPEQATNLVAPSIAGSAVVGESLVANVGQWKFPGTTYTRQWYRCEADGGSCQTLSGQKAAAYTLTGEDVGKRLKAEIVADSNAANVFPAPVSVFTPLSAVVTTPPAPAGAADPAGPAPSAPASPGATPQQQGAAPAPDTVAPVLGASLARTKIKRGGSLALTLKPSEGGRVRIEIQSLRKGRRQGGRCRAGARKGSRCTIARTVLTKTVAVSAGGATVKVALKTRGRKLKAGRYRARLTPVDAAGNRGTAKTIAFRISR